jgi:hypothetical protein
LPHSPPPPLRLTGIRFLTKGEVLFHGHCLLMKLSVPKFHPPKASNLPLQAICRPAQTCKCLVDTKCYMSLKRQKNIPSRPMAPPAVASSTSVPELPGGAGLVWRWAAEADAAAGAAADAGGGRRWGLPPTRLGIGLGLGFGVWASGFGTAGVNLHCRRP